MKSPSRKSVIALAVAGLLGSGSATASISPDLILFASTHTPCDGPVCTSPYLPGTPLAVVKFVDPELMPGNSAGKSVIPDLNPKIVPALLVMAQAAITVPAFGIDTQFKMTCRIHAITHTVNGDVDEAVGPMYSTDAQSLGQTQTNPSPVRIQTSMTGIYVVRPGTLNVTLYNACDIAASQQNPPTLESSGAQVMVAPVGTMIWR
jgi:hypothetical protein